MTTPPVDDLKYQKQSALTEAAQSDELLTLKLRYKQPEAGRKHAPFDFRSQTATPQFGAASRRLPVRRRGGRLRHAASQLAHTAGNATYDAVAEIAQPGAANDAAGYRAEFLSMVRRGRNWQVIASRRSKGQ